MLTAWLQIANWLLRGLLRMLRGMLRGLRGLRGMLRMLLRGVLRMLRGLRGLRGMLRGVLRMLRGLRGLRGMLRMLRMLLRGLLKSPNFSASCHKGGHDEQLFLGSAGRGRVGRPGVFGGVVVGEQPPAR